MRVPSQGAPKMQPSLGPLVVSVESVTPQLTRIHLTRDGIEVNTLEAAAFTITTGASGTTITCAGTVTIESEGRPAFMGDGLELRIVPGGSQFSITSK